MGAADNYSIIPSDDHQTMNQEPARGLPTSLPPVNVQAFANEKRGRKMQKGRKTEKGRKNRLLICFSNVKMAVLDDEEGKEDCGHDKVGVAPGIVLGHKSCLVMCFSNLQVGTTPKSVEKTPVLPGDQRLV